MLVPEKEKRILYLRRGALGSLWKLAGLRARHLHLRRPCIVFQMGKVGSTSIVTAVNNVPGYFALQAHKLNPKTTALIQRRYLDGETYFRDMILERGVYNWLRTTQTSVKIIVPLREPFSHTYSSFFQNIQRNTRGGEDQQSATVRSLRNYFFDWEDFGSACSWIDNEYSPVLNHSPYDYPFDPQRGVRRIRYSNYEILLFKSNLDDEIKCAAIDDFLGVEGVQLERENLSESKEYRRLFYDFSEHIKIPREIAERWAHSRYMKHFFTESEIAKALQTYSLD